mmetsp:Transcript_13414/g.56742  ORF Transcript_13414/g.56742 Transcript_13414/m.56742 type:complete len:312 (+) Transcript_13414:603-1538(+)
MGHRHDAHRDAVCQGVLPDDRYHAVRAPAPAAQVGSGHVNRHVRAVHPRRVPGGRQAGAHHHGGAGRVCRRRPSTDPGGVRAALLQVHEHPLRYHLLRRSARVLGQAPHAQLLRGVHRHLPEPPELEERLCQLVAVRAGGSGGLDHRPDRHRHLRRVHHRERRRRVRVWEDLRQAQAHRRVAQQDGRGRARGTDLHHGHRVRFAMALGLARRSGADAGAGRRDLHRGGGGRSDGERDEAQRGDEGQRGYHPGTRGVPGQVRLVHVHGHRGVLLRRHGDAPLVPGHDALRMNRWGETAPCRLYCALLLECTG